jgi:hypothetical protein
MEGRLKGLIKSCTGPSYLSSKAKVSETTSMSASKGTVATEGGRQGGRERETILHGLE